MRIVARLGRVVAEAGRRRLDVVGEPHAEVAAGRAGLGLLGAERVVVEHLRAPVRTSRAGEMLS